MKRFKLDFLKITTKIINPVQLAIGIRYIELIHQMAPKFILFTCNQDESISQVLAAIWERKDDRKFEGVSDTSAVSWSNERILIKSPLQYEMCGPLALLTPYCKLSWSDWVVTYLHFLSVLLNTVSVLFEWENLLVPTYF